MSVRVTDYERQPLHGFEVASRPIVGDCVRHEVTWDTRTISALEGQEMPLEFQMKGIVDLYSFCFAPEAEG